jgi:hypothetical protein
MRVCMRVRTCISGVYERMYESVFEWVHERVILIQVPQSPAPGYL